MSAIRHPAPPIPTINTLIVRLLPCLPENPFFGNFNELPLDPGFKKDYLTPQKCSVSDKKSAEKERPDSPTGMKMGNCFFVGISAFSVSFCGIDN
jgi:hypothetical protein